MDEIQEAHNEIDWIQAIITRHEGHIFALRGWFITVVGALLAAYYAENIVMSVYVLIGGLIVAVVVFYIVEFQHSNLIESLVGRVKKIEKSIKKARLPSGEFKNGWYNGPKVNKTCRKGAKFKWPHIGMTFLLNTPFYIVVLVIVLLLIYFAAVNPLAS